MSSDELHLQPYALHHVDAVQRLAPDPENLRYTLMPDPYPDDGAATFLRLLEAARRDATQEAFAIVFGNEVVGMCGVHDIDLPARSAEIGYWVGAPFRGAGVASAAVLALLEECRARGLIHLRAHTLAANPASARVLERCGFAEARRFANMGLHERWPADAVLVRYVLDLERA